MSRFRRARGVLSTVAAAVALGSVAALVPLAAPVGASEPAPTEQPAAQPAEAALDQGPVGERAGMPLPTSMLLDAVEADGAVPEVGSVERSTYAETEYLGDGSYRTDLSAEPLYRTGEGGELVPVDPRLLVDGGVVQAPDAFVPTTFADGSNDVVTSFDLAGATVDVRSLDLEPARAVATGDTTVEVATDDPDVSLRYEVGPSTVKEEIVIGSSDAPTEFEFFISDPDGALGEAARNPDGGYSFSGTGDLVAAIAPAVAWQLDADGNRVIDPLDGVAPTAHLEVTQAPGGFRLRTWVDERWLAGKTFPIVLDPTFAYGRPGLTTTGAGPVVAHTTARNENCGATRTTCVTMFDYGYLYTGSLYDPAQGLNLTAMRTVSPRV